MFDMDGHLSNLMQTVLWCNKLDIDRGALYSSRTIWVVEQTKPNSVFLIRKWYYSETTWAVGIAQSIHHEVQGGGKNPETGGRVVS